MSKLTDSVRRSILSVLQDYCDDPEEAPPFFKIISVGGNRIEAKIDLTNMTEEEDEAEYTLWKDYQNKLITITIGEQDNG